MPLTGSFLALSYHTSGPSIEIQTVSCATPPAIQSSLSGFRRTDTRVGQFGYFGVVAAAAARPRPRSSGPTLFIIINLYERVCVHVTRQFLRQVSLYGRDAGFEDNSRRRRRRHACNRRSDAITQRDTARARHAVDIDHDRAAA